MPMASRRAEVEVLEVRRARLDEHLVLVVVLEPVRVLAVAPVGGPARGLDVGRGPGARAQRPQRRGRVEGARAHLHVVGLQDRAALRGPVGLEAQDDLLEGTRERRPSGHPGDGRPPPSRGSRAGQGGHGRRAARRRDTRICAAAALRRGARPAAATEGRGWAMLRRTVAGLALWAAMAGAARAQDGAGLDPGRGAARRSTAPSSRPRATPTSSPTWTATTSARAGTRWRSAPTRAEEAEAVLRQPHGRGRDPRRRAASSTARQFQQQFWPLPPPGADGRGRRAERRGRPSRARAAAPAARRPRSPRRPSPRRRPARPP